MYKFLAILHLLICMVLGYGCWYLVIWFFTNQNDLFEWTIRVKIFYFFFGMFSSEGFRTANIKIEK